MQSAVPNKPVGTVRETQRLATKSTILDVAIEHFAARGFEGSSLPDIAKDCGSRVSLILYHFGSKLGLWEVCIASVYDAVERKIEAAAPQIAAASGIERLQIAIATYIRATAAYPAFHRLLFQEAMQDSDRLAWLVEHHQRAMSDRMVALIEEAKMAKLLPADASSMHLKFVVSGMFALPIAFAPEYRLLAREEPIDDTFIDQHIALCLRLILG